jgi:hypothetical protein
MFDAYNLEQLNRILTASRWALGIFAIVTAGIGILNQCISDRISVLQNTEKTIAETRLKKAEEKLAPRALSSEQEQILSSSLKEAVDSGTATVPIAVASRLMDSESLAYGTQLFQVVQRSGWPVNHTEMSTHSFPGIAIFFNPPSQQEPALEKVRDAFRRANIAFSEDYLDVNRTPIQTEGTIYIIVGHKSTPP